MKLELKNLKIAEFASEETTCYQATVYVDGVRAILASNEGHGGPDNFIPYSPYGRPANDKEVAAFNTAMKKIEDHCDSEPPHVLGSELTKCCGACSTYVEDVLCCKVCFEQVPYGEGDGNCFSMKLDLSLLIADQMNAVADRKHLQTSMKSKVLYIEDDKVWQSSFKGVRKLTPRHIEVVADKHPEAVILNSLPLDEACDLYKEFCQAA